MAAPGYVNNQLQNTGMFVQTTPVFDVSAIYETEVTSPEFKELLVRLYQQINNISSVLNFKTTGLFLNQEFVDSNLWFNTTGTNSFANLRPEYITVVNFGALPNAAGTKSVAHGITLNSNCSFTYIGAFASDTTGLNYIPIPYSSTSALANNIELTVDSTNVNITVGKNQSNFNICYVILKYLKN